MEQAIVRNVPGFGYDIVNATPNWPQDMDIFFLLPEVILSNPPINPRFFYFSKNWLSSPSQGYLIKFIVVDYDEFGRCSMKTHCLWLSWDEYITKGLPFYISPLLEDKINPGTSRILEETDFKIIPIHLTAQKILEEVLSKPFVSVKGNLYLQNAIARQFSFIDYALPDSINTQLSIHSYLREEDQELRDKFALNFCFKPNLDETSMDWLRIPSSYITVQELAQGLENTKTRRTIQKKLLRGEIKEKQLLTRIQRRFDLK